MNTFTLIHVGISLVGILSGLVVVFGMLAAKRLDAWTMLFLATTVATSVTGFFFPFQGFTPAHATGIVSLVALSVAIFARYGRQLTGAWRKTYVIGAVTGLYLNVFVLIVQSFLKIPALTDLAPTQSEPPFQITQFVALALFIVLGAVATIKFRSDRTALRSAAKA
jgi:hypothetical protein